MLWKPEFDHSVEVKLAWNATLGRTKFDHIAGAILGLKLDAFQVWIWLLSRYYITLKTQNLKA